MAKYEVLCSWRINSLFCLNHTAVCLLITTFHLEILEMKKLKAEGKCRSPGSLCVWGTSERQRGYLFYFCLFIQIWTLQISSFCNCVCLCVRKCVFVYILKHLLLDAKCIVLADICIFYSFWCWDYERYSKSEWQGAAI